MTHRLRSAALAGLVVIFLAGVACGRYGPPRRIEASPAAAPAAATVADPDPAQPSEADPDLDLDPDQEPQP